MSRRHAMLLHTVLLTFLVVLLLAFAQTASAYMKLIRQGTDSTEIPNTDDAHGRAVVAGDFNGDGFQDLAMGAPDESNGIGDIYVHGGVVVSYGSAAGITHVGADWLTVGDLGTDDVRYGRALAAADFDNDGYCDLAVGLPFVDHPLVPATDAGAVWIHRGSAMGLQSTPDLILDQGVVAGAAVEDNDLFGFALTTGLFNDDVYPDLAVGSIGEDSNAGAVFYFFGSNTGLQTTNAGFFKQGNLGESPPEGGAWLGYALTSHDFDGNGRDDIAAGAPKKTVASLTTAGRVYVVYSTSTGPNTSFVESYDALGLGLPAQSDAWFGAALASGRYWTPTAAFDLAIGEPQFDVGSDVDAGRAVVLRFDPPPTKTGAAASKVTPTAVKTLIQSGTNDGTSEPGDEFGYALASGNISGDAIDELAVGVPFETLDFPGRPNLFFAGQVFLYNGKDTGPSGTQDSFKVLTCETENDHTLGGETFGMALAFGAIDDSGYEALAIGAPGRDYEDYLDGGTNISGAGAVYISAPWRQPVNRPHRSSVVWDCAQNIVYAQRPFDLVNQASTTKAVTCLLACEAAQTQTIAWDYPYVVDWSRPPNIGGSLVPLIGGETMEFHNLMKVMMAVSGNDAGYALGDVMTGETAVWSWYTTTLPGFATMMNNRIAQIGLSGSTHLTNPSGMDYGNDSDHRTNAMDWVKVAHAVMQNPCVREIVGEPCWIVPRDLGLDINTWLNYGDPVNTKFCNGYVNGLKSGGFPATGVKSGGTPSAWLTGLGSASALGGEVYTAFFGVREADNPEGAPGGSRTGTGRDLLAVGRAACDNTSLTLPPPGPSTPFARMGGVSTELGSTEGMCFSLLDDDNDTVGDPQELTVSTVAQVLGGTTADFRLAVVRTSTAEARPTEELAFNYGKVSATEGMEIQNMGEAAIDLSVVASHPTGSTWSFNIAPGDVAVIPPANVGDQDYQIALTNNTRGVNAQLGIHQPGILVAGQVGDGTSAPMTHAMATSVTGGAFADDQMCVYFAGQDPSSGSVVGVSAHQSATPTAVFPEAPVHTPGGRIGIRLLASSPNPFNPSTSLRFALDRAGRVDLRIYDLKGRLVRVLESGTPFDAGPHDVRWNGQDDSGRAVASGVYVVRLSAGGESASQRIALLK